MFVIFLIKCLQAFKNSYNTHIFSGQMAERLNAPVLKTGDAKAFLSSNLSLSAISMVDTFLLIPQVSTYFSWYAFWLQLSLICALLFCLAYSGSIFSDSEKLNGNEELYQEYYRYYIRKRRDIAVFSGYQLYYGVAYKTEANSVTDGA